MPDRLDYIKQKLEEYKKSPAVILRHSDGEWAVGEIERLRAENERLNIGLSVIRENADDEWSREKARKVMENEVDEP
jgi:hypothetical protein